MSTYLVFVIGTHVTSVTALCGVVSGLQQLFVVMFFHWTVVLSLHFYLSQLGDVQKRFQKASLCFSLFSAYSML